MVESSFEAVSKEFAGVSASLTTTGLEAVSADALDLAHLLNKIFDNAFRYRKSGEVLQVHVESTEREGRRWIRVVDNGEGFDVRALPALKWPMLAEASGAYPMMGFGLPIVALVVRRHLGKVLIDSGPGVGTSIEFTLQGA
jgi:signal transduction histidine kinase